MQNIDTHELLQTLVQNVNYTLLIYDIEQIEAGDAAHTAIAQHINRSMKAKKGKSCEKIEEDTSSSTETRETDNLV